MSSSYDASSLGMKGPPLFLLFSGLVFAQTGTVGVSEGDWFTYGFSFDYYSDSIRHQ